MSNFGEINITALYAYYTRSGNSRIAASVEDLQLQLVIEDYVIAEWNLPKQLLRVVYQPRGASEQLLYFGTMKSRGMQLDAFKRQLLKHVQELCVVQYVKEIIG